MQLEIGLMSFGFECRTCGETHLGLPSFGPDAPDSYAAMNEAEKSSNAVLGSDNCIIENRKFFVRGRLELPILGREEAFVWLVWCSLSEESYSLWEDAYYLDNRSHIGPFFGWLNNELPFYEGSLNLATSVHLRDDGIRAYVEVHASDHRLFKDQCAGISDAQAEQLVQDLLHHM